MHLLTGYTWRQDTWKALQLHKHVKRMAAIVHKAVTSMLTACVADAACFAITEGVELGCVERLSCTGKPVLDCSAKVADAHACGV